MITISQLAKIHLSKICQETGYNFVRLELKAGGCAGLKYSWTCDENSIPSDKDEQFALMLNKNLIIDRESLSFLKGGDIDVRKEISGSYITVKNLSTTSKCGCGESFGV